MVKNKKSNGEPALTKSVTRRVLFLIDKTTLGAYFIYSKFSLKECAMTNTEALRGLFKKYLNEDDRIALEADLAEDAFECAQHQLLTAIDSHLQRKKISPEVADQDCEIIRSFFNNSNTTKSHTVRD